MPDDKMRELCTQISGEKDSKKLMALVEQLTQRLGEEQKARDGKINPNRETGKSTAA